MTQASIVALAVAATGQPIDFEALERRWILARAWLARELVGQEARGS